MLRPKAFLQWAVDMFGQIAVNRQERAARFIEEALELVHADGLAQEVTEKIVERVYSRPMGDLAREIGQAHVTLAILAENIGLSADEEGEREFARVQSIPREEWQRRHEAKVKKQIALRSADASFEPSPHNPWPKNYRDQFWAAYPRRIAKADAVKRLETIRRSGKVSFAAIMDAVEVLKRETQNTEMQFIPHPATWLNRGRWQDDPAAIAGRPTDGRGEIKNGFLGRLID